MMPANNNRPTAGARVGGTLDRFIYGQMLSDAEGKFSLGAFPVGTKADSFAFTIRVGEEQLEGKVESTDPLVVRLQPKTP